LFELPGEEEYILTKITFTDEYKLTSRISLTAMNNNAAGLRFYAERTDGGFVIKTIDKIEADKQYIFDYIVIGADILSNE
jgi:hypothetical protein